MQHKRITPASADDEKLTVIGPSNPIANQPSETRANPYAAATSDDSGEMAAYESLQRRRKEKKRAKVIRIVVICAIVAVAIIGYSIWSGSQAASTNTEISTTTVEKGTFTNSVTATGETEPVSSVIVSPEVDGIIDTVDVTVGQTVSEGDTVYTLKNDALDKAVTEASNTLKSAQNGVDTAVVELNNAQAALTSYQNTYNNQVNTYNTAIAAGNTSVERPYYDDTTYTGAIDSAQESLNGAVITRDSAKQAYDEAVATADKRTVKASTSGTVIAVNAKAGEAVSSSGGSSSGSSASALVQIADLSEMKVTVQVNEVDITKLAVGQPATASYSALSDASFNASITNISTVATTSASSSTGSSTTSGVVTYPVELLIPSPSADLKPGMTANVTIITESIDDALMVPTAAIQTDDSGNTYITVVGSGDNQTTIKKNVTVRTHNSTTSVITGDSIAEGDEVVLSGGTADTTATS